MDNKKICAHKCCICGYYKSLMSYPVSISFHSIPTKTNALADAWQKATGINKTLFLLGAKVRNSQDHILILLKLLKLRYVRDISSKPISHQLPNQLDVYIILQFLRTIWNIIGIIATMMTFSFLMKPLKNSSRKFNMLNL